MFRNYTIFLYGGILLCIVNFGAGLPNPQGNKVTLTPTPGEYILHTLHLQIYSRPKMSGTSYLISKPLSAITEARMRGE